MSKPYLTKCPVCGKEISSTAASCPNCGEKFHNTSASERKQLKGVAIFTVAVLLFILIYILSLPKP